MAETLNVQVRDSRGSHQARHLRRNGMVPAVLYGHKEQTLSLSVSSEELSAAIRHGSRLVDLRGAVSESALIREVQWDPYGHHVLHLDFARVSADERIEVTVAVELRGEAPGVRDGGIVQQPIHEVMVECLAIAIPEKLTVSINHLALNGTLLIKDLVVPQGVTVLADPDDVVVQCVEPQEEQEEQAPAAEGAEPELIGRKAEEEAEEA